MRSKRLLTSPQFPIPLHTPKQSCQHKAYYLTCDQYDTMRWRSGDRCEICRVRAEEVQKRPLYIDHDGRLGNGQDHVRGLVCARCNHRLSLCDSGRVLPDEAQQRYLDDAWFWAWLPPQRLQLPYLPPANGRRNGLAWVLVPCDLRNQLAQENFRARKVRLRARAA